MDKKEEFKKLMDTIMEEYLKEVRHSKGTTVTMPFVTKHILGMLTNLNNRIEERDQYIERLEKQMKTLENDLKILIHELNDLGYINLGERRKVLKRSIITQDALVDLLEKKDIISNQELRSQIKRMSDGKRVKHLS